MKLDINSYLKYIDDDYMVINDEIEVKYTNRRT